MSYEDMSKRQLIEEVRALLGRIGDPAGSAAEESDERLLQIIDLTRHRRLERLLAGHSHILQLLTQGTPLDEVLTALVRLIEEEYPETLGSVLLLDREGVLLHHAAAPSLPEDYVAAIDGIAIGPAVGSCGTSAYCGTPVIVEDIARDPLWATYRDLALDHGLRSCWSQPIISSGGRVLGTFAMYYRDKRRPGEDQRSLIVAVARLAGVAIEFREAQEALEAEIVEHRRTAELVRHREEEYRLTFENAPLGLVTSDADGRFLRVNQAMCEMLGYTEDELLQSSFMDITHPDDLEKSLALLRSIAADEPNRPRSLAKRYVRADGGVIEATVHTVQIPERVDQPMRTVSQVVDNTERIRAENEARQQRERLAHVTRISTLGEMAAGIAHEVNQPLTAIATYAQASARMLRMGIHETSDVLSTLDQIASEAIRGGEIIHRMQALARRGETDRMPCDINYLVRQVAGLAELDARLQGVNVKLVLEEELPPVIADGVQLQQVILNLIRNGIEASAGSNGRPSEIEVRTVRKDPSHIEVSVIDSGTGISQESADQVFEPFFTTKETGMGMGLSIGRSIVSSHGGRMWFTPNSGPGTTFSFTIPIQDGAGDEAD